AEQTIEERRLAGTIRTDQPDDLAFGDVEAHVVERGDPREGLGDAVGDEQAHDEPAAGAGVGTSGSRVASARSPTPSCFPRSLHLSIVRCTRSSERRFWNSSTPSGCFA